MGQRDNKALSVYSLWTAEKIKTSSELFSLALMGCEARRLGDTETDGTPIVTAVF